LFLVLVALLRPQIDLLFQLRVVQRAVIAGLVAADFLAAVVVAAVAEAGEAYIDIQQTL
jgi:hypothetical protein